MARQNRFYQAHDASLEDVSGYHDPVTQRFIALTKTLRKKLDVHDDCFVRKAAKNLVDDRQLALATSNISAMLVPGGVFLHNEARPILGDLTTAVGLPFEQSRRTVIATITGAPPLGDSIFIHVKR